MATFKIKGLEKVRRHLSQLQKNARDLNGKYTLSLDDIFPAEFMREHSSFASIDAMYNASPFRDMKLADVPDDQWDAYVKQCTKFQSWKDMKAAGTKKWASKKLMKGLSKN